MNPEVAAFLDEIRQAPEFKAAVAAEPVWLDHYAEMEDYLRALYASGGDDADAIDMFDDVVRIVRKACGLKARVAALSKFLVAVREGNRSAARTCVSEFLSS